MRTEFTREKQLGGGTKANAIPPRESWKQPKGTTKVAKVGRPELAHVSRRAVSPFVCLARGHRISRATYLRSMSLQHGQPRRRRCRPSRPIRAKTHESNDIAPAMWGVVTRTRPAPSTQTIENKRTILRHRARGPRKTEISPYMRHSATFYKETLYMKPALPAVSMTLETVGIGSVGTA